MFGNTTNYGSTLASGQSFGTAPSGSVHDYADYLQPSEKYYYKITASGTCSDSSGTHTYTGSTTGYWTEGNTLSHYIDGFVKGSGGNTAPSGVYVNATCVSFPDSYGAYSWDAYTTTSSTGYFSLSTYQIAFGGSGYDPCGNSAYRVNVINSKIDYGIGGQSSMWNQHWNETIVTFSPSEMYFSLEQSFKQFWPMTVQFANTPNATLAINTETTWTTTSAQSSPWQSFTSSATASWSNSFPGTWGSPNELRGYYWTTGAVEFNAVNGRTSSVVWSGPYSPVLSIDGTDTFQPTDWATIGQFHGNEITNFSLDDVTLPYVYGNVSATTSMSWSEGSSITVGVSLDLFGVGSLDFSGDFKNDVTTTATHTLTISYELRDLSASHSCIAVATEFGSGSQFNGMVVHIWQNTLSACGY